MRIKLDGSNDIHKKYFEVMYRGFMIGGSIVPKKGITILRRELGILARLENISKECDCGRIIPNTDEKDRELNSGFHTIEFNDDEFNLLMTYIGEVPWTTGKSTRAAIATLDYLKECEYAPEVSAVQG